MQQDEERAALVELLRRATKWRQVTDEVAEAGSALEVWARKRRADNALFAAHEDTHEGLDRAREQIAAWRAGGVELHTLLDEHYPQQLRDIREMPPLLFSRGHLLQEHRAVAVVGTRRATERGIEVATTVATALAAADITVVSGLAAGIDTTAHRAALRSGGRTVAVLGTGMLRSYPPQNAELQETIARQGLVLSQFWPDAEPTKQSFPMRNSVMSGYAAATIVVEANWKSGARNQAEKALQHGRSVILPREALQYDWASSLSTRPGVWVVDDPEELVSAANKVIDDLSFDTGDLPELVPGAWS